MDEINHHESRIFTLEEANRLVPQLTDMLRELQSVRNSLAKQEVEIDVEELLTDPEKREKSKAFNHQLDGYNESVAHFYEIVDRIHELGCFLKDPNTGLIDFYANNQGRMVYLCWRLGESAIEYWHEVGLGFRDRQPISRLEDGADSNNT